jgi:hypothetical protein
MVAQVTLTSMRRSWAFAVAASLLLTACGGGGHVPDVGGLPLARGSQIIARARTCDRGANPYCAEQLVVVNPRFRTAEAFLQRERAILHGLGWTGAYPPNGNEHSDDSPSGKLHVTFATPYGDLIGIELGWIKRERAVELALSHAIFAHTPALSVMVQAGPSS